MFSLLIPAGTSLAIMLSLLLIPEDPFYLLGPFLGVIVFFPLFMFIRRKVGDAVSPRLSMSARRSSVRMRSISRRWEKGLVM